MYDWASKKVRACQACGWCNLEAYSSGNTPVLGANFDCEYSKKHYAHGTKLARQHIARTSGTAREL